MLNATPNGESFRWFYAFVASWDYKQHSLINHFYVVEQQLSNFNLDLGTIIHIEIDSFLQIERFYSIQLDFRR